MMRSKFLLLSLWTVGLFLLTACGPEAVTRPRTVKSLPVIWPDYVGVTVPANIAPLNFCMQDTACECVDVVITGARGGELHAQGEESTGIPLKAWKALLAANIGDSLRVQVSARFADGWRSYLPFGIHVSRDSMDYGLNYRLIEPGYEVYSKMGIYERDLSTFEERALLENTRFNGCVNCHAYNRGNPADLSLHIRGQHGATLIRKAGQMAAYNTQTDGTLGLCVYPYWHPSGNYIAYSTNNTRQGFHVTQEKLIEVFDLASDVQVYDLQRNELIAPAVLKQDSVWETFPAFSPDGKTLYFCAAQARPIPAQVKEIRYNLCRVSFDAATGQVGAKIDTLVHAEALGKSVSFPKPSYDGRYLMYTLSDYGNFSIWHHEADLWLLDLKSGETRSLTEANSSDTESYHNWSSNSRWFVFSSRRDDGLFTRPYLCHFSADGKAGKPFLLPQENPRRFYDTRFFSFNVPEFVTGPVPFDDVQAEQLITSPNRIPMGLRK